MQQTPEPTISTFHCRWIARLHCNYELHKKQFHCLVFVVTVELLSNWACWVSEFFRVSLCIFRIVKHLTVNANVICCWKDSFRYMLSGMLNSAYLLTIITRLTFDLFSFKFYVEIHPHPISPVNHIITLPTLYRRFSIINHHHHTSC